MHGAKIGIIIETSKEKCRFNLPTSRFLLKRLCRKGFEDGRSVAETSRRPPVRPHQSHLCGVLILLTVLVTDPTPYPSPTREGSNLDGRCDGRLDGRC